MLGVTDTTREDGLAAVLPALSDAFGLGAVSDRRFLAHGLMNRNWRLVTATGVYALKEITDVPLSKARRNLAVLVDLARPLQPDHHPRPLRPLHGPRQAARGRGLRLRIRNRQAANSPGCRNRSMFRALVHRNGRRSLLACNSSSSRRRQVFPTIERRFWRSVAVAATGVLAAGLLAAPPAGADTAGPVLGRNFPDPDVVRVGRTYHAYATNGEAANIQHATSTDLVHWSPAETDPLPRLGDWAEPTRSLVWAPEVFANGHGFTMHYTARDRASGKQCIGVALSSSPDGPFLPTGKGPLVCPAEQGAPSTPRAIRRTAGGTCSGRTTGTAASWPPGSTCSRSPGTEPVRRESPSL